MAMLRASPAHGARPTSHPLVRASTSTSSPWRRIASMISIPSITRCKSNDRSLSLHHPLPRCCLSLRDSCKPYLAMPRDYEEVLRCLSSLITQRTRGDGANRGDQFDLMFDYLKILDLEDAISQLKVIHVAGTKGKGSTCTFTESILRSCGFRTGLFTSPHLIDIRERFRLDGVEICEDKFLDNFWWCWNRLKEKTGDHLQMPSYFRFLTLLAFKIFLAEQLFLIREQLFKAQTADVIGKFLLMVKLQNTIMKLISRCKVEVAIMEVGLGGKYDATNVVREPIVCGITSLGYDHMEILGNTLGKIAGEKAGIFKKGVPAYTAPQPEEAMKVLVDKASQLSISLQVVSPLDPGQLGTQHLGLHGEHQYINASLAIALSSTWLNTTGNSKDINLDQDNLPEQFIRGLSRASLEGRAQIVPDSFAQQLNSNIGDLTFYLDGAHSPESLEMCAKWFSHVIRVDSLNLEKQSIKNNYIRKGGHPNSPGGKEHLHILLFNCMSVRDPQLLLPRLVNTCAHLGVKFHKAIFVPNQSVYNKVSSDAAAPPADAHQSDLSWQLTLQRVWQNVVRSEQDPGDISEYDGSLIFPSLPLAIKWLRESALQNRSTQFQVLVTGSLHLVGDVLRLIRK